MAEDDAATVAATHKMIRQQALALWQAQGQRQNNTHWLPIVGHSMLPLLREGDQVLVVRRRHFAIGDLALFLQGGQLIVHRVVARGPLASSRCGTRFFAQSSRRSQRNSRENFALFASLRETFSLAQQELATSTWITQGDNCCAPDRSVPMVQMLGKVIAVRRGPLVHRVDSWQWQWVNPLIGRCASSTVCRPVQRLLLRICAAYLRRVLKG